MRTNKPIVTQQWSSPGPAELERLPWAFTQRDLLNTRMFRDACTQRGTNFLEDAHLETLHREGILVPLARRDGDHEEPAGAYRPWRSYPTSSQFLYSPYQLLAVPVLDRLLPRMTPHHRSIPARIVARVAGRRRRPRPARFHLDRSSLAVEIELSNLPSRFPDLVIALSALEARYLPDVVHQVRAPLGLYELRDWPDYAANFDPEATLGWLGWRPEQLTQAAEQLLVRAHAIDPQQSWHRLARLVEPRRWADLRGHALVANDYRVAAELLLHFYEDLAARSAAPPLAPPPANLPDFHPLKERLVTDRDELEEVLTQFGLSPHPSVVLAVEGETEELIVERIIELLVAAGQPGRIRVRNRHGATRDLTLLADEVARPLLGARPHGNGLLLLRPPTRLLVTGDAEGRLATPADCANEHRNLVDQVDQTLRRQGVAVDRSDLESLVEIRTWGTDPYEFAHFTNDELAKAAIAQSKGGVQLTTQSLAAAFGQIRTTTKNIAKIGAVLHYTLDKLELADALWPVLESKIKACHAAGNLDAVPIAAAVERAVELAREPRRNVTVRPAAGQGAAVPPSP
jgi:hypothetical protein